MNTGPHGLWGLRGIKSICCGEERWNKNIHMCIWVRSCFREHGDICGRVRVIFLYQLEFREFNNFLSLDYLTQYCKNVIFYVKHNSH